MPPRIRPFILRRTKSAVATELPPKHTILRRITLAPDQRELYETIRATMHEKVTQGIAARGVAQSHILVLDALLKLRQVCCDPRLVKLPSARLTGTSSKLDDLLEMVSEMVAEGRRILLFSQFTSMLDLIKPALTAAGIRFVELRGDTADRAAPVRRFEAGEVPLFLISLKAGGRGLNLTSADTVDSLRSVVEPGGRGSGIRSRPSHRPDQIGVRLQADRGRHRRGADRGAAGAQGGPGEPCVERGRHGAAGDGRGGHRLPVRRCAKSSGCMRLENMPIF